MNVFTILLKYVFVSMTHIQKYNRYRISITIIGIIIVTITSIIKNNNLARKNNAGCLKREFSYEMSRFTRAKVQMSATFTSRLRLAW